LTSVPSPPSLLLILIIVVATVPQASVSRHDLELSTVQRRRRGDTQAEGKRNRKAVWAYEPSRTISRTIGRDLHTRRIVSPNAQTRERLTLSQKAQRPKNRSRISNNTRGYTAGSDQNPSATSARNRNGKLGQYGREIRE
jgi:hypothetical protein